jgi:hypothetical protein
MGQGQTQKVCGVWYYDQDTVRVREGSMWCREWCEVLGMASRGGDAGFG